MRRPLCVTFVAIALSHVFPGPVPCSAEGFPRTSRTDAKELSCPIPPADPAPTAAVNGPRARSDHALLSLRPLAALAAFPAPRDLVRSGALLTPAVLRSALAARRERLTRTDVVTALNLELVTLAEDHAVITWYTAVPGTDDGFGHLVPAVTEGEVVYGTHPAHLNRTASEGRPTAHHHVELTDLEPGQTYYYQARSRGRAATPTPLHLVRGNAVGTSLHGLGSHGGPYSFTTPEPPPAATSCPSRSATTCTWARPRRAGWPAYRCCAGSRSSPAWTRTRRS